MIKVVRVGDEFLPFFLSTSSSFDFLQNYRFPYCFYVVCPPALSSSALFSYFRFLCPQAMRNGNAMQCACIESFQKIPSIQTSFSDNTFFRVNLTQSTWSQLDSAQQFSPGPGLQGCPIFSRVNCQFLNLKKSERRTPNCGISVRGWLRGRRMMDHPSIDL